MSHIQILVGSVTGTAERIADLAAERLQTLGHQVTVNRFAQLDDLLRSPEEVLLICTSNTGSGDLPDNLQPLYVQLTREFPPIAGRLYGLINLGDSSYTTFGAAGQAMDDAFADLGAQRIGEPLVLDASSGDDPEPLTEDWVANWATQLPEDAA